MFLWSIGFVSPPLSPCGCMVRGGGWGTIQAKRVSFDSESSPASNASVPEPKAQDRLTSERRNQLLSVLNPAFDVGHLPRASCGHHE